jgi:hypothetical protein
VIAGYPGDTLPLTEKEATSFHSARLPENRYVVDASLLSNSLGNPPILTIIAMAKRISKICQTPVSTSCIGSGRLQLHGNFVGQYGMGMWTDYQRA